LNSLVAFEAAARHLSFTRTAAELNVTQGAISRQIRHLETYLGRVLFVRDKRQLALTPAGEEYFASVQQALQLVASATSEIKQWQGQNQISVVASYAMASMWLLPRLPEFEERHPDIEVRILATDNPKSLHPSEFDIAVFYFRNPPRGMTATPLFRERVFPICSPAFFEKHTAQAEPAEIFATTLLCGDANDDALNWHEWFCSVGMEPVEPRRRLNLNNYLMQLQAALNGQGVALGWEQLTGDYLDSGLLIKPVPIELITTTCFYVLEPEEVLRPKPAVAVFRNWLLDLVKEDDSIIR
jgi:DNA-binding transcriptional LysR family regulator